MLILSQCRDVINSTLCSGFATPEECLSLINKINKKKPVADIISEKFRQVVYYANENLYKFVITGIKDFETVKFDKNTPVSDWKVDLHGDKEEPLRKLSLLVFLSPESSYKGGRLHFDPQFEPIEQEQGTLVIFPAFLNYRFDPLTEGELNILKCWVYGPPFR
jgi:hypothetical protein